MNKNKFAPWIFCAILIICGFKATALASSAQPTDDMLTVWVAVLYGTVTSYVEKQESSLLASEVRGVRSVDNQNLNDIISIDYGPE